MIKAGEIHDGLWPVLKRPDWLPKTEWSELEEVRERHIAVLKELGRISDEVQTTHAKYDHEDAEYQRALKDSFAKDDRPPKQPRSAQTERNQVLKGLGHQYRAGLEALADVANQALALIEDKQPDWQAELNKAEAEVEREVAKLQEQIAALNVRNDKLKRLMGWVERSAGQQFGFDTTLSRLFPFSDWGQPSELQPDVAHELAEARATTHHDVLVTPTAAH